MVLRLDPIPRSVGMARGSVDRFRERLSDRALDDARLLVTELVTNSIRHAGLGPGQQIELSMALQGGVLRVDVVDPGRGFDPSVSSPVPSDEGGWGLVLVDRLADRWGVQGDGWTRVWFELHAVDPA